MSLISYCWRISFLQAGMGLSLPDFGRERVLLYSALVRTNH
jgi:hypothetical protein